MTFQRKLVAIMFTDIAGYTALMQRSEKEAIAFREKHREVFNQETQRHGGKVLQYYGDGTLSVFDSAVDAVKCGIAIQKGMKKEPEVPVRIGIHTGDIVFNQEDIIGDGVNVASRVESLAEIGSILISEKVFDEIKNHGDIKTQFLKEVKFKNVTQPMAVYAIANEGLTIPNPQSLTGKIDTPSKPVRSIFSDKKKQLLIAALFFFMIIGGYGVSTLWQDNPSSFPKISVAIIPFEVETIGEQQAYFSEGMTDGLIQELSKVHALSVLDLYTSRLFAGPVVKISEISEELDQLDYIISGTVAREGYQVNTSLGLFSVIDSQKIWSNTYSCDISAIRQLWPKVAREIAEKLGVNLEREHSIVWEGMKPVNPETYELYLKGTYYISEYTPDEFQRGMAYLQEAVDKNPADAFAWAGLAAGYITLGHTAGPPPDVFHKAKTAAMRAIQLDSTLADGWAALAHYETYFGHNWETAERAFMKAHMLNPNQPWNHYHRAWYLALFGRIDEAIEEHKRAKELDPFNPAHTAWLGELYAYIEEYEKGLEEVDKAAALRGPGSRALAEFVRGRILIFQGKSEEAVRAMENAAKLSPPNRYAGYGHALVAAGRRSEAMVIIEELKNQPINSFSAFCLATMYACMGEVDSTIQMLNYEPHLGIYPWIRVIPTFKPLHKDPRFLQILKDMNLPPPGPFQYKNGLKEAQTI